MQRALVAKVKAYAGTPPVQAKLSVGRPGDRFERQADAVADAVVSRGSSIVAPMRPMGGLPAIQRKCTACGEEERPKGGFAAVMEDEMAMYGGVVPRLQLKRTPGPVSRHDAGGEAARAVRFGGESLPSSTRRQLESRMGHDFGDVRVHTHERASRAADGLGARSFTTGRNIAFARGQYAPHTSGGKWLLAHELTHVIQQGAAPASEASAEAIGGATAAPDIQLDLAIAPPNPAAVARPLTEAEITAAIRYNDFRFKDPYSIAVFRDVIGVSRFPAVSDRDMALAVAQWQAQFGLTVDGKAGPGTTRTLVRELRAEGLPADALQLRRDNFVTVSTVGAVTRNVPSPAAHGLFRLDANFRTSLRNGWIIQRLDNTWNETVCGGAANPNVPTAQYWEAWWVNNSGEVRLPTSVANPPTHVSTGTFDDRWQRGLARGTRGSFTMTARLYTATRLPAGFVIRGVTDAGDLPATTAPPNPDRLGLVEGRRRESGSWNGCPAVANFHTP